jgi:predicted acyltransferase
MTQNGTHRLLSLDYFRGVTIAGMIFSNSLSAWTDTPRLPRLTHAEWHGCTLVDLIYPLFIFSEPLLNILACQARQKYQVVS